MKTTARHGLTGLVLVLGACAPGVPPQLHSAPPPLAANCATSAVKIRFDFETASSSRCIINAEREFTLLVAPEHAPPINPSPWYAFRYEAQSGGDVTVHLHYLVGKHRYAPKWDDGSGPRQLAASTNMDATVATIRLPAGRATVSAQEIFDIDDHHRALMRWAQGPFAERFALGLSHDRRPIAAVRLGRPDAPHLILLLGRQHPPEVTGAIALESFVDRIAAMLAADPALTRRYQFVVVPLLNPDGVARGHWRANLGGKDLNRDWGEFAQPETRALKRWLDRLPASIRPILMLDFHSTNRNLFYVQGDEATAPERAFLAAWLGKREGLLPGYPFSIERRNATPDSGTTKNWFHAAYAIPAYTYEVCDDTDRADIRRAAAILASDLPLALDLMAN